LGERLHGMQKVIGSSPLSSTFRSPLRVTRSGLFLLVSVPILLLNRFYSQGEEVHFLLRVPRIANICS
jgi:hypothetical protein